MRNWMTFPLYLLYLARRWRRRHPRRFKIAGIITAVYTLGWVLAPVAHAAGDGKKSPSVPGDALMSSDGIRASHYASLFIDHGWFMEGDKKILAGLMDLLWSIHYSIVTSGIDMLVWTLSFEWVSVISIPMQGIAGTVSVIVSRLGIVPLALVCSGVVVGVLLLRGKFAKGIVEYTISATVAVLAMGILASPITWVVGPHGPLESARNWGANLSAAITSGDGYLSTAEANSTEILGASVVAPLVDLMLARPSEYLAFGHTLSGDCRTDYIEQVKALDPVNPDLDKIRKDVGSCDAEAKSYSEGSAMWRLGSVAEVGMGSTWIWVFSGVVTVVFFLSVLGMLWSALLTSFRAALAAFPYTDRSRLLVAVGGIFAALFFIVASQIALAGIFKTLNDAIGLMEELGWSYQLHLKFIGWGGLIAIIALIAMMIYIKKRAKRAAERAAKALENLGTTQKAAPLSGAPAWVGDALKHMAALKLAQSGRPAFDQGPLDQLPPAPTETAPYFPTSPAPTSHLAGGAFPTPGPAKSHGRRAARKPEPETIAGGEMTSTPVPPKGSKTVVNGKNADGVKKLGSGVMRYALAARGGVPGIALQAVSDVAQKVASSPAIEISPNGSGHVARNEPSAHRIESWDRRPEWTAPPTAPPAAQQTIPASMKVIVGPDGNARVALTADAAPSPQWAGA